MRCPCCRFYLSTRTIDKRASIKRKARKFSFIKPQSIKIFMVNGRNGRGRIINPSIKSGVRAGNRLIRSRFGPNGERGRMMRLSSSERRMIQRQRQRQANPFRSPLRTI